MFFSLIKFREVTIHSVAAIIACRKSLVWNYSWTEWDCRLVAEFFTARNEPTTITCCMGGSIFEEEEADEPHEPRNAHGNDGPNEPAQPQLVGSLDTAGKPSNKCEEKGYSEGQSGK